MKPKKKPEPAKPVPARTIFCPHCMTKRVVLNGVCLACAGKV